MNQQTEDNEFYQGETRGFSLPLMYSKSPMPTERSLEKKEKTHVSKRKSSNKEQKNHKEK